MLWWSSFIVRPLPSTGHSFKCGVHPWIGMSAPAELRWNIWVYDRTECFFEYCPQFVYCCPFPDHLYDIGCQSSNFCSDGIVVCIFPHKHTRLYGYEYEHVKERKFKINMNVNRMLKRKRGYFLAILKPLWWERHRFESRQLNGVAHPKDLHSRIYKSCNMIFTIFFDLSYALKSDIFEKSALTSQFGG